MSATPLQVQSFDHITLIVADLEATREFYVGKLGMTEHDRPAFDFPGAWFGIGNMQIHATVASDLAGLPGWADRKVKSISRGHHFAFQVSSVAKASEAAVQNGIEIATGPQKRPDGVSQVYLYDPDGHLVELFSNG
ncbi:MAG: VOC family protein [Mariniblastus sp.]